MARKERKEETKVARIAKGQRSCSLKEKNN
jgi:hypothetical protein